MEYDESKVYTMKDADKLKIGSRIIVADNVFNLKYAVKREIDITTLTNVLPEDYMMRFRTGDGRDYALAYLVAEPEEKKSLKLIWTDLKLGDVIKNKEGDKSCIVTAIEYDDWRGMHIFAGAYWINDLELENWEKVEEINNGGKNA